MKLAAQEVRVAAFHGSLIDLLSELNENIAWRSVFGKHNIRRKDEELILRFLALNFESDSYTRPFNEFLNKFCEKNRNPRASFLKECKSIFDSTIETIHDSIGRRAFRPGGALNAAVFDAVMVGVAMRLKRGAVSRPIALKKAYDRLIIDEEFSLATSQSTADEASVKLRLRMSIAAMKSI